MGWLIWVGVVALAFWVGFFIGLGSGSGKWSPANRDGFWDRM